MPKGGTGLPKVGAGWPKDGTGLPKDGIGLPRPGNMSGVTGLYLEPHVNEGILSSRLEDGYVLGAGHWWRWNDYGEVKILLVRDRPYFT
jgi:hypothetical protein